MILMKTLFKVLALGMFLTMLGVMSAFAQQPSLEELFNKYKLERREPCGKRGPAVETGKKIIELYGSDELNKEIIDYVKKDVAKIEEADPGCKAIDEYNASYKAKDWPKFSTLSKQLIAKEGNSPLALDIMLTLVSVGYDQAVAKVDTYNNDTLNYAKQAIQRIEAGGTSSTGNWGTYNGFKTKTFPDGKTNSLNWMNYIIGYVNYYRLGATDASKKKEGLVYLYKSTLVNGENKNDISIYRNIGNWYFDQAATLDEQIRAIRAGITTADTEENKTKLADANAKLALAKGFADRAIDAFGRGRQIAVSTKDTKNIDSITKKLGDLYRFRFNLAPDAKTPELEGYVSNLLAKPMPDPSTEVTPVVEEVKPTTTSTTPTTTPATNVKTSTTTTPSKQPTSATTNANTATTTKTPVKKPVTKKKGTR